MTDPHPPTPTPLPTRRPRRALALAVPMVWLAACATVPGKTREAQVETVDHLVSRTLEDLYKQEPKTRDEISRSIGYAIMNNKVTKIPMVGAGTGYGVAIDNRTGEKTYIRMTRFDMGWGGGIRSVRPVFIFHNEKKFNKLVSGFWAANVGVEAAAKVGETGAAGGGAGDVVSEKGYTSYFLTDAGVSATATAGVVHIQPVKLRKGSEGP